MLPSAVKRLISTPRHSYPDDFIRRLRHLVIGEGMLNEQNIFQMDHVIRQLPSEGHIVEIGIYGGLSTNVIVHLLKKYGKSNALFNCDPWVYEGYHDHKQGETPFVDGRTDLYRADYTAYMKEAYIRATRFLHADKLPFSFQLFSDDFFEKWSNKDTITDLFGRSTVLGGPIAFAYIDGNHSYEQSTKDYTHVMHYLVPGGFILLDDSSDSVNFGSAKLAHQLKTEHRLKLVDNSYNHLFQKRF